MVKTIVMPFGNGKHSRYAVNIKPVLKSSSSSSTKLASDCCGKETGLKRYCKECGEHTAWKPKNKIFEFNKEEYVFEADKFESMLKSVENSDIEVIEVLDSEPREAEIMLEKAYYIIPERGNEAQLAELKAIIGSSVLLVEFNERNSSYQGLIKISDGKLVLKRLAESDIINEVDEVEAPVKAEVVDLKRKILANKQRAEPSHDITQYTNKRAELEGKFFEALIDGTDVGEVVSEAIEMSDADELSELKELAGE